MDEQLAIQKLLRTHLLAAQSKNPKFSLRSYSRKVDIHFGALSAIMNGKRNVSKEMAEKITRKLLVDPGTRSEILSLFPEKRKYRTVDEMNEADSEPKYLEIEASTFKLMAEWEHFAVLSLVKTDDFRNDYAWIAGRLGISKYRAQEVVERLLELGFLALVEGDLIRAQAKIRSSDDTVNLSVRKSHEDDLELARESLNRDAIQFRDFTSITMPIDPKKMDLAKEMIRKFQDELSDVLEADEKTEVYRLSVQLFPLTKLTQPNVSKEIVQ